MPDSNDPKPSTIAPPETPVNGARNGNVATETLPAPDTLEGRGGGRRRLSGRDLTTGSIPRHIFHLSWPQVIEGVLNVADQMVDLVWAGRLPGGFRALAGVGVAQSFVQFGFMSRQGLDMSMRAMVSRAVGAGELALANRIAVQALSLTVLYGLLMILVGVFLTDFLLGAIGASEAIRAETSMYMKVQFVGMLGIGLRNGTGAALQSAGDVITPLKATTLTRVFHISLTPFLMFGWGFFPTLGLAGAGLANVLAQALGCALNIWGLFSGTSRLKLTLRGYRPDWPLLKRLVQLGAPASVAGTERAVAQLVLLRFVTPFGDIATAAYAMTRRMEMFANFGSMGIGQAAGIMVGQNLGAKRPERAKQAVGWALAMVGMIKGPVGLLLILLPGAFVVLFTQDAAVMDLTVDWVRIQVFASILMGLAMVFQQSYNNAGDTWAPMVVTLLAVWGIELPLAWYLSHTLGIGPLGIGIAAIAGMGSRVLIYIPYFFKGRWLKIKVI